jgi:hypothetical protein
MGLSLARKIHLKSKMYELMQDFIERHQLGFKIARKKLERKPKFLVIDELEDINKIGRTGLLLLKIKFNSDEGSFQGSVAIKEFSSETEAQRLIKINNWLLQRVFSNPNVRVPDILCAGGRFIVYEGIEGETFEETRVNPDEKLKLAGEALCTFHEKELNPVLEERYFKLIEKMIELLPISYDRKERLRNIGISLFNHYYKRKSGVFDYGDFHPGNILIDPEGTRAYLIDPEFIEFKPECDRFEDIANFFIFDASREFNRVGTFTETLSNLNKFLQSYDNHLIYISGVNIDSIYQHTQWMALFFHLGLTALIKGAVVTQTFSQSLIEEPTKRSMEEIIQSYRMAKELWLKGISLLPTNSYPRKISPELVKEGWVITWGFLAYTLNQQLTHHPVFKIIFNFPNKKKISIEEALKYWKFKKKQDLEKNILRIQTWTKIPLITLDNKNISLNPNWKSDLGLLGETNQNWETYSKNLYKIYLKDHKITIISHLAHFKEIKTDGLEKLELVPSKKSLKKNLERLKDKNIITINQKTISLNPKWKDYLKLPHYFEFSYFY